MSEQQKAPDNGNIGGMQAATYDPCYGYLYTAEQMRSLQSRLTASEAECARLREMALDLYATGYERGHNDCADGHYAPPRYYPDEFPGILDEHLREAGLPSPPTQSRATVR